jgi:hypothetical protein
MSASIRALAARAAPPPGSPRHDGASKPGITHKPEPSAAVPHPTLASDATRIAESQKRPADPDVTGAIVQDPPPPTSAC